MQQPLNILEESILLNIYVVAQIVLIYLHSSYSVLP